MSDEATQEEVEQRLRGHNPTTDERLTVRVPGDLDAELDVLVESGEFRHKSGAVRAVLRAFVDERGEAEEE